MGRVFSVFGLALLLTFAGCSKEEPPAASPAGGTAETESADPGSAVDLGSPSDPPAPAEASSPSPATSTAAAPKTTPPKTGSTPAPAAASAATAASNVPQVVEGVDLSRLPPDAALALVVRPSRAFGNELVQGILKEVEASAPNFKIQEAMDEMRADTGTDVTEIDHVLVALDQQTLNFAPMMMQMMMGPGMGPQTPPATFEDAPATVEEAAPAQEADTDCQPAEAPAAEFAAEPQMQGPPVPTIVVAFNKAVDQQTLVESGGKPQEKQHGGKTYYAQPGGMSLYFADAQTAVLGPEPVIHDMIDGKSAGAAPLAEQLSPLLKNDLALALDVRPLHQTISDLSQQNPNPILALVGGLIKQVNTLTLTSDLTGENLIQIQLHAINEGSATGLRDMLGQFLEQGKQAYAQQKQRAMEELTEAQKGLLPVTDKLVQGTEITAEGTVCTLTVPRPEGIEELPSLVRPLLDDVSKQQAAMVAMNSYRQLGIAFHNYHDVYKSFPAHGGPGREDAPGEGLSWRVHLLPYIEQAALYDQFNLEEPWDSEHNKALIAQMPEIYGDDPEGKSRVHVFVSEGTPFGGEKGLRFQDVLDGTSNTILLVQAGPSTAQPWTKPGGLELNADDPRASLGDVEDQTIIVMMDGRVLRINPKTIDAETLKNLIRHDDGNPVQLP